MKSFATEKKKQLDDIAVSGTRRHSRAADIWLRLVRDKSAVVSLVLLGIIILLAIFADVLFDKSAITTQNIELRNCPPSCTGLERIFTVVIFSSVWCSALVYRCLLVL